MHHQLSEGSAGFFLFVDDFEVDIQIADQSGRPLKLPAEEKKVAIFSFEFQLFSRFNKLNTGTIKKKF